MTEQELKSVMIDTLHLLNDVERKKVLLSALATQVEILNQNFNLNFREELTLARAREYLKIEGVI